MKDMDKLDPGEKEILNSFDRGEWVDVPDPDLIATYEENAKSTFKRDKRINIRLTQKDFEGIQKRALKEGIPYQTMIAGIIHKYLSDQLVEQD